MIFVFKVSVERCAVDHCAIAKVYDADFLDGFFFHHIEQRVAQKLASAHDAQIFFVGHIRLLMCNIVYIIAQKCVSVKLSITCSHIGQYVRHREKNLPHRAKYALKTICLSFGKQCGKRRGK